MGLPSRRLMVVHQPPAEPEPGTGDAGDAPHLLAHRGRSATFDPERQEGRVDALGLFPASPSNRSHDDQDLLDSTVGVLDAAAMPPNACQPVVVLG